MEFYSVDLGLMGSADIIASPGVELYARRWDPETPDPKGVLVLVHGDLLWSQFFKETAVTLASKGYVVYAFDLMGYGSSGCFQGVQRHVKNFDDYLSDLELVVDFAKSEKPGVPCFVFGEDLGGTIALAYSTDASRANKVAGFLLSSPMLAVPQLEKPVSSFGISLFPLATGPKWKLDYTFNDLFSDPEAINTASAAFDEQNPPTARKVLEVQNMCDYVNENLDKVTAPFLLMHGNMDVRNAPGLSDQLQKNTGSKSIFFRPYPDYKHGLLSDSENSNFPMRDMQAWLSRQSSRMASGAE